MSISKADLDKSGCSTEGCGHDHSILWLHSRCHPKRAVQVRYEKEKGELVIECFACEKLVARIKLESGEGPL